MQPKRWTRPGLLGVMLLLTSLTLNLLDANSTAEAAPAFA